MPKLSLSDQKKKEIEDVERNKILEDIRNSWERSGIEQIRPENYDQSDFTTATWKKMGLSKKTAAQIFLDHRYLPRSLLAEKYGATLAFPNDKRKPVNIIQRIYQHVIRKPQDYAEYLTEKDIKEINDTVTSRAGFDKGGSNSVMKYGANKSVRAIIAEPIQDAIEKMERMSDKAQNILEIKLDTYKNKGDVKSLDLKKAVEVVKVLNEMKRLEKGEATEHVAHYVKAEQLDKMDTSELINVMNSQRSEQK